MGSAVKWLLLGLAFLSVSLPIAPFVGLAAAQDEPESGTFLYYGYGDQTARGMAGSLSFFFPLPPGHAPEPGGQLELLFSHSALLMPDRSSLTIAINGQSVASTFLTSANSDRARLRVTLPAPADFAGTGYFVQAFTNLRLTHEECEENSNAALWLTVHGESRVQLVSRPADSGPSLANLQALFAPSGPEPNTIAVTIPQRPAPDEIEAAGLVGWQIGRWAAANDADPLLAVGPSDQLGDPSILVGSAPAVVPPATLDLTWDGQNFATSGGMVPTTHGVLALAKGGAPTLVVGGASPAATLLAATTLVDDLAADVLSGTYTIATGLPIAADGRVAAWSGNASSFGQLGLEPMRFEGNGDHTISLVVDRPSGWVLRDGAAIDLVIAASPALRPETSWLVVIVNGLEVGSRRLEGGDANRYRLELPAALLRSDLTGHAVRDLRLEIRLLLDVPQGGCQAPVPTESAWATILPTSAWFLPSDPAADLDLGRFPAPLIGPEGEPLAVVVPADPTTDELGIGVRLMAALGRWTVGAPNRPRLLTADRIGEADRATWNLILVGGPDRNALSRAASEQLPDLFAPGDPALYQLDAGQRRGLLRLARSPWSTERTILAIVAASPRDADAVVAALLDDDLVGQLQGSLAAVGDGLSPQMMRAAEPPGQPPAELVPRVEIPLDQRIPAWQIVGAVLFGAVVATVILVVVLRWRR